YFLASLSHLVKRVHPVGQPRQTHPAMWYLAISLEWSHLIMQQCN
ncbi:uncharacterized protein METZ01_LOCUS323960, partial [marine metagenome]